MHSPFKFSDPVGSAPRYASTVVFVDDRTNYNQEINDLSRNGRIGPLAIDVVDRERAYPSFASFLRYDRASDSLSGKKATSHFQYAFRCSDLGQC